MTKSKNYETRLSQSIRINEYRYDTINLGQIIMGYLVMAMRKPDSKINTGTQGRVLIINPLCI